MKIAVSFFVEDHMLSVLTSSWTRSVERNRYLLLDEFSEYFHESSFMSSSCGNHLNVLMMLK